MAYHNDDVQYHTHLKKGDVGRYVLLPGDPFRTDLIASYLDDAKLIAHNREHKTWTGYLDGVKVSVTSTGMGCPSTAICVEELIKVGADTFIRIGTAGRVSKEAQNKKYIGCINTAAVRDEGTTSQYIPIEFPAVANRQVVEALAQAAENLGYNYIEGITQSKDSFFGEIDPDSAPISQQLKDHWDALVAANVVSSEMESAAIFIISQIKGCRASSLMSFESMEKTIEVAREGIRILIKQDAQEDK